MVHSKMMSDPAGLDPLPDEFALAVYQGHPDNTDLRAFSPAEAVQHYALYGRKAGRICNAIHKRAAFLALVPTDAPVLEIGPFCLPSLHRPAYDVRYLDALSTEELRERARGISWADPDKVPPIDYVWRGEPYRDLIHQRFEAVYSAHNLEHQLCLVSHFNDVATVLAPGRRYFMTVPDKRYCFDHFRHETTIADVLDAWHERRTRHTARTILGNALLVTHNDPARHWEGEHGDDPRLRSPDTWIVPRIHQQLRRLREQPGYIDGHAWQFTPDGIRRLIDLLRACDLIPFEVERVYPTVRPWGEFHVVLRLTKASHTAPNSTAR